MLSCGPDGVVLDGSLTVNCSANSKQTKLIIGLANLNKTKKIDKKLRHQEVHRPACSKAWAHICTNMHMAGRSCILQMHLATVRQRGGHFNYSTTIYCYNATKRVADQHVADLLHGKNTTKPKRRQNFLVALVYQSASRAMTKSSPLGCVSHDHAG